MTGAADAFATLTFTYDSDGRLSTDVTSGPGTGQPNVTLSYSYDQLGDETSVTDSLSTRGSRRTRIMPTQRDDRDHARRMAGRPARRSRSPTTRRPADVDSRTERRAAVTRQVNTTVTL